MAVPWLGLIVVAALAIVGIACTALLISYGISVPERGNWGRHATVMLTLLPLSILTAPLVSAIHNYGVASLIDLNRSGSLPSPLDVLVANMKPINSDITLLDVLGMMCVLFVAYAAVVILRLLIDITRLLKMSMRRVIVNEHKKHKG